MKQIKISKDRFTNRDSKSIDKYLQEINKIPLIDSNEEVELAQKIKEGDKVALERLINANLRFVVSIAKQYQYQGLTLGDLINQGNLGLIKAAKKFDETKGFKFISYAVWWIRQSMIEGINDLGKLIRVPANKVEVRKRIYKKELELYNRLLREPSPEEIFNELNDVSWEDFSTLYFFKDKHLSLDHPLNEEDGNLYDVINNDEPDVDTNLMNQSLRFEISRILSILEKEEKDIIVDYYGLNDQPKVKIQNIAARLELSNERVRQIKIQAEKKLKRACRIKGLFKTYF